MIIIISPAKTIDLSLNCNASLATDPVFPNETKRLAGRLKRSSMKSLQEMMHISPVLAKLNADRYKGWDLPETQQKQAIAAFKGEVYNGLKGWTLSESDLLYAQDHLRILSGLYGLLKPLDQIKPHRLEMGTNLAGISLYKFWGLKITKELKRAFTDKDEPLINLASNEYFKSINISALKQPLITPVFKDWTNNEYKVISVYAKKARGLMCRFILENRIEDQRELLGFTSSGYYYNAELSKPEMPVFTRDKI